MRVWDAQYQNLEGELPGCNSRVITCAFSKDGQVVATGSENETVTIWDGVTGDGLVTLLRGAASCDFSIDGGIVVVASGQFDDLYLIDRKNGSTLGVLRSPKSSGYAVLNCAFSPDSARVAAGYADGSLRMWDTARALRDRESAGEDPYIAQLGPARALKVTACGYSPDGRRVLSGFEDGCLVVWDLNEDGTYLTMRELDGHRREINKCVFSPDGNVLVSASADATLKLWDAAAGDLIATLSGHRDSVNGCDISPDGKSIVSVSADRTVKVWDVSTHFEICEFVEGSGIGTDWWASGKTASGGTWFLNSGATAVSWCANGTRIIVGYDYGSVYLFQPGNLTKGPSIVTARRAPSAPAGHRAQENFHIGCPTCLEWSEVSADLLGKSLGCPSCNASLLINEFTILGDWRRIADAWRGGKDG